MSMHDERYGEPTHAPTAGAPRPAEGEGEQVAAPTPNTQGGPSLTRDQVMSRLRLMNEALEANCTAALNSASRAHRLLTEAHPACEPALDAQRVGAMLSYLQFVLRSNGIARAVHGGHAFTPADVEAATEAVPAALRVWTELSVLTGCSSPDGCAELEQARYAYERAEEAEKELAFAEAREENLHAAVSAGSAPTPGLQVRAAASGEAGDTVPVTIGK